ncbi:iron-phytosiderophore transporter YSL15 [Spinacia oleracea]|uniref:Iron-phytosiderophore transporter YSL15 n=1 Tax=Spinacia oleracea TaxID=3562 RepID=A0ABM3R0J3_SPIOL|nr:iron-phytosiderophore transporter YSL15-like [Spinacia oleracea]
MIQTCAVACYSMVIQGGFRAHLLALNKKTYELARNSPGNPPGSYKELQLRWVIGYNLLVCFVGLFVLIPLRKVCSEGYGGSWSTSNCYCSCALSGGGSF